MKERVAILVIFRPWGPQGPEVFLQLHSSGEVWRFFGGHLERGETPLQAVVREAREELNLKVNPQELGEGWTPVQLLSRLRFPAGRVFLFPFEVEGEFPPPGCQIREGARGEWWPVRALPEAMSLDDRLLLKWWLYRRQILNQPYLVTGLACPIVTIDLEERHHYGGRSCNARFAGRDARLPAVIAELLSCLESVKAKATFFCVAETARKYRQVLREIVQAGH